MITEYISRCFFFSSFQSSPSDRIKRLGFTTSTANPRPRDVTCFDNRVPLQRWWRHRKLNSGYITRGRATRRCGIGHISSHFPSPFHAHTHTHIK